MAIYYIGKFLLRFWIKSKVNEQVRRQRETVEENEAKFRSQEKGKVTIKKNKSSRSGDKENGDSGDYVDYEEIKE